MLTRLRNLRPPRRKRCIKSRCAGNGKGRGGWDTPRGREMVTGRTTRPPVIVNVARADKPPVPPNQDEAIFFIASPVAIPTLPCAGSTVAMDFAVVNARLTESAVEIFGSGVPFLTVSPRTK